MGEVRVDRHIDIRGFVCPITFVKAKLAIESMEEGEVLEILLDYEEASRSIPKSMEEHGHRALSVEKTGEKEWVLRIEKGRE
jgi:TusA-related sulfurtransferase